MDTALLRALVDVARRGSFAAVARDRDVSASSVSRKIAALESELGIRLFQRTTRRMALTEAGERYLARIAVLLDELDRAGDESRAARFGPVGTLRLTASVAFGNACLMPLIPELRASFPKLKLELVLTDAILDLLTERIDLAIRLGPSPGTEGIGVKLLDTRYRVCAAPDYIARSSRLNSPADLANHRCVLFSLPDFRSRWLFRSMKGALTEVPIDGDVVISNALAVRHCAIAGVGPALLPNWLIDDDVTEKRLLDLFPNYRVAATSFDTAAWLLYPSRAFLPQKVRVAIDFLKRRLRTKRRIETDASRS
ncbi:MAG TPA: LysR family transcriptional regulator [Alphaproteobacteria bacterium]|nr:LysR family transcriptional regulator [Alphaproteobacteria bacterium]